MRVRDAVLSDLAAIVAIYNRAIETGVATFDLQPFTVEERAVWFAQFGAEHPLLVCEDDAGRVLGYAYYAPFRAKEAYAATKETTIYTHEDARRRGVASQLYQALIAHARAHSVHVLVAVLGGENRESIALHEKFGFERVGSLRQVGFKFGGFVDTPYYQLVLPC